MSEVNKLKRQVQSLTDQLKSVKLGKAQKRGGGPSTVPGGSAMSAGTPKGKGKKGRRGAGPASSLAAGEIVFTRSEQVKLVKLAKGAASAVGHVDLQPDSFPFLKNLWKSFERIKWLNISVRWVPAVGTTFGGLIAYGADYSNRLVDSDRAAITALTPNKTHALWVDSSNSPLVLPPSRLQTRLWYVESSDLNDHQPCRMMFAVDATAVTAETTVGEFWISYKVQFSGTRAP